MADIIDNRSEKLEDHIRKILLSSQKAYFAVGYLFLSGLKPFYKEFEKLKELRLLIGNTTDKDTIETLVEGYGSISPVNEEIERWAYRKRTDRRGIKAQTKIHLRHQISAMDQSREDEELIRTIVGLIKGGRLKVRIYTKGRLHAKAYIFDYGPIYTRNGKRIPREENGIAIVGSSNLSLSGLTHNTELNVIVHGNDNHEALKGWFEQLWDEAEEFTPDLMEELSNSWAEMSPSHVDELWPELVIRPYDIYMKTLYELIRERLEDGDEETVIWGSELTNVLTDFQKAAVRQAIRMIKRHRGCFIADVVGLGKSFIGAAVVEHFKKVEGRRPLIICPAGLVEMWERYNEGYELDARVLSMGMLREREDGINILLDDPRYSGRDFVLIDESHNFRYQHRQRYGLLWQFLSTGDRLCALLTATPRNKTAWDIYHQIKLFHQADQTTTLLINPPDLRGFFKMVESGRRRLQELLSQILIRRTRTHVLKWYGYDAETGDRIDPERFEEYRSGKRKAYILVGGKPQFFPKRMLQTISYSIEETYQGLYDELRWRIGRPRADQLNPPPDQLTYARYGLWHYVIPEKRDLYVDLKRVGANLVGLTRILLFKRLESSVYAFKRTLQTLIDTHTMFLEALENGIIPAGEEAQKLLYESDKIDESDLFDLLEELKEASRKYRITDFNLDLLREHIEQDIRIFEEMLGMVEPITPERDAKLQTLREWLNRPPLNEGKRLIFTQFADTAEYLFQQLNPEGRSDIEVIYSADITKKGRDRIVGRFAPRANSQWFSFRTGEVEINTLIATDVLSEGLNLQDCDKVINYDLHWNPVRLIQRFGRIDRIGSEHDLIYAYNFLPEKGIEKALGLREKLEQRIREIHETIGEDAPILDPSERINEEAMYAIYENRAEELSRYEEEEGMILDEAVESFRRMRRENPKEFERIVNLRDGIRSAKRSDRKGTFIFLKAGQYKQLMLIDRDNKEITRDIEEILRLIRCDPDEPAQSLLEGHGDLVTLKKWEFDEEVRGRTAEIKQGMRLSPAQRYIIEELEVLGREIDDEDIRRRIEVLERCYRHPRLPPAVIKAMRSLYKNKVKGENLLRNLEDIYHLYRLYDVVSPEGDRKARAEEKVSKIICSEGLV